MSRANPRRRAPMTGIEKDEEVGMAALITTRALQKAATFHSPVSSPESMTFVPPSLPRSQSHFDEVVNASCRRIALTLQDIDETLARTADLSLSGSTDNKPKHIRDTSLPVPQGLLHELSAASPSMAKVEPHSRILRPRPIGRAHQHESDSGLGSSIASTIEKCEDTQNTTKKGKGRKPAMTAAALTGSGASTVKQHLPALSQRALGRIHEHTLRPLLAKPDLKDFEPLILDVPRRIRSKEIICLRDLEKMLIFLAPNTTKSANLYLDFCLTSVTCIQATVEYLTDQEQVRPGDRPYTNGYFIDLKHQILEYGKQLASAKQDGFATDGTGVDKDDEIRLYGGLAENGRPAELIRVKKDGSAISMATGKPVDLAESPVQFKRSLSAQKDDEEEIMRSMARRKKNPTAEDLAPKKCREHGCNKEFKRLCDLSKHEKTHSRPWKCPVADCKYHDFGWPTQKEMDRHVNDKHSDAPAMFECSFKPCQYRSKRESNCKQHMEKSHGWTYVRTKTNGKKRATTTRPANTSLPTPPSVTIDTPNYSDWSGSTPHENQMNLDFPSYSSDGRWFNSLGFQAASVEDMTMAVDQTSPSPSVPSSYEQYQPFNNSSDFIIEEDIYTATLQISEHCTTPGYVFDKMALPPPLYGRDFAACTVPQLPLQPQMPAQFSPVARENTMLFTPNSQPGIDETFDDSFQTGDADFLLYSLDPSKDGALQQPLFDGVPSANLGFSQTSQQDIFMDWASLESYPFRQN